MKTLLFLIIYSFPSFLFAQILNFNFSDANGHSYQSINFNSQIKEQYNHSDFSVRMILIETPDLKDSLYLKQFKILDSLDAEKYELAYISVCLNAEKKEGYHTSVSTAKELMNNIQKFRVRILNTDAEILFESIKILSCKSIEMIVLK